MVSAPQLQQGQLHRYSRRLVAFEHATASGQASKHILLWVGGLGDGLLTVSYVTLLSQKLPPEWSLAQVLLSSSYKGWGLSSLQRDVKELAQCVEYFRGSKPSGSKIVLMGHSTGCQDLMEYVTGEGSDSRPPIDGAILQAPVSDREAISETTSKDTVDAVVKTAQEWIKSGRENDVLPGAIAEPLYGPRTIVTAYRSESLISPNHDGDDDYFSSDLPDAKLQRTFGAFKKETPLLILFSGADEHVPSSINKAELVRKWSKFVKNGGGVVDEEHGGVVEGAHHNLEDDSDEVLDDLARRVHGFLKYMPFQTEPHL